MPRMERALSNEMDTRIAQLTGRMAVADARIAKLERTTRMARRKTAVVAGLLIASFAVAAFGQSNLKGVAVVDPLAKISQKIDAIQKQLQTNINYLDLRVRKLEQKIDSPDPDKDKDSGKPSKDNGSSHAIDDLIQRVNLLEHQTVVRAPFRVNDSQGHAIFTVSEESESGSLRGAEVFNAAGALLVSLDASNPAGGMIKAISATNFKTWAALYVRRGAEFMLVKDNNKGVSAAAHEGAQNGFYVYGNDSNKVVSGIESYDGNKGQVAVYNANEQNVGTLTLGANGAELQLDDMSGKPMVEMGTLPTHVGIVRTGPASRAPGGLMGVPGSYITGKGN